MSSDAAERGKADLTLEAVGTDGGGNTVAPTCGRYRLRAHGN